MPAVLIVDDDPDIREMLAFTLAGHGFAVRQAGDGAEALASLAASAPDCVVLDLMLPELDGFGVLASRRDTGLALDAKIVVLSCRSDEAALVRAWELGADAYLVKPTDPDVLVARIRQLAPPDAA